jgi:hypothetical protein
MTPTQLADLRRLAISATPGPWDAMEIRASYGEPRMSFVRKDPGNHIAQRVAADDALFIAAASPDVVIALLDELERSQASEAEAWAKRRQYFSERNDQMCAQLAAAEHEIKQLHTDLHIAQAEVKRLHVAIDGTDSYEYWSTLGTNIALRDQLAAVTAARDRLVQIAHDCNNSVRGYRQETEDEIDELRKVGKLRPTSSPSSPSSSRRPSSAEDAMVVAGVRWRDNRGRARRR